ncbi:MAG: PEP-CTERM sorting domain-containing protein [Gemmatimonadaceae bacterium]|nr:PEP-CTERM sorting domain-containing protein [Gemmatimonadaceae bacterium]
MARFRDLAAVAGAVFGVLAAAAPTPVHAQNLLFNGSFEAVGTGHGQALLANGWTQAGNIYPGADTYSMDGDFGLTPTDWWWWNIGPSANAARDGRRFAAAGDWNTLGVNEAFGQQLAVPLQAGQAYALSGSVRAATGYSEMGYRAAAGRFDIYLSSAASFDAPDAQLVASLDAPSTEWTAQTTSFLAPSAATSLSWLVFVPRAPLGGFSYLALDNVELLPTVVTPEPGTWALLATGLFALLTITRRRRSTR